MNCASKRRSYSRGFRPLDRMPCDQQVVRVGELPDVTPAPVPDRIARAEARELLEPPSSNVRFADVDRLGVQQPVRLQRVHRDGRVLALEPAARVPIQENRGRGGRPIDDVGCRAVWDLCEVARPQFSPRAPTDEADGLKVRTDERGRERRQRVGRRRHAERLGRPAVIKASPRQSPRRALVVGTALASSHIAVERMLLFAPSGTRAPTRRSAGHRGKQQPADPTR